jgi:muramoyltetrapeptide carboxypeptidase
MLERDDIRRAVEQCRALGYEGVVAAHADAKYGYLAGTDDVRLADFNQAVADPSLDAVWCLRGGYGTPRILAGVDYRSLAKAPKALIGFSDITALLLAVTRTAELVTFHAPVARGALTNFSREALQQVVGDTAPAGVLPAAPVSSQRVVATEGRIVALAAGRAEGPLLGGNLTLLCHLVGTPYLPDPDGAILFIEDVGEELYAVDRCLAHLRLAGVLERVAGVAVGQFTDLKRDTPSGALGLEEVLDSHLRPLGVPVAFGFPIGHIDDQWTLPIGVMARLDADGGTLEILESAVH